MSIRPPEVSHEPYFYYLRPELVFPGLVIPGMEIPELIIPSHLQHLIDEARETKRFIYDGYKPVIKDTLNAHITRVSRLALAMWHIADADKQDISLYLLVHDLPELRKTHDMTATDKVIDPLKAKKVEAKEDEVAKTILTPDDYQRFLRYQTAKPLLEGKVDPLTAKVIPNAILAKVLDVFENETYHHTWVQYLWSLYQEQIYNMLPPEDFTFSRPRLKSFRSNIVNLGLPQAHLQLAMELFDEAEAFARVSLQRED